MFENFDFNTVGSKDEALVWIRNLLNLLEVQQKQIDGLKKENRTLRDEINRLKGEQGKPDVKPNKKKKSENTDYSSEKERKKKKKSKKRSKIKTIEIHNEEIRKVDRKSLPEDAEFKGYKDVVVQDINLEAFNTKFPKEFFYSPSQKKCYTADLPTGYKGEFGPTLKTLALSLYFDANVSEGRISALLEDLGTSISKGCLSNLLIKDQDVFHREKQDVFEAGIASTFWRNIDDTGTRVDGRNWYCQIVCNHLHTSYFTTEDKSRLSVLKALVNSCDLSYILNSDTFDLLGVFRLSKKVVLRLKSASP
ncbi:MAG: hypothetical protein GY866_04140 [Proteobacteria bacterium]|nr:hypothetical protein [Pseudomonadota bacterium]